MVFQPPDFLSKQKSSAEALLDPITQAVQTIPELHDAYLQRRKQQELQALELELKKREILSKFGTGIDESIQPGKLISAPSPEAGPEEQMFGADIAPPKFNKETPEQELRRVGSEAYGKLHPIPTTVLSATGTPLGSFSGRTEVLPSPQENKEAAKLKAKIDAERPKAIGSAKNTLREFDNMIDAAKSIRDDSALSSATGLFGGRTNVSEGQRRIDANLDTLKAKTLLNVLASLKDLSKNGASGFGQLSELEGENIRNSISSLKRTQGTKDFQASLDRFINEMLQKKKSLVDTFNSTYGESDLAGESAPTPDSGEHDEALTWAQSNPGDPRAQRILKLHGL
jgi:hypothetical protein